jgi:hypothetical protein
MGWAGRAKGSRRAAEGRAASCPQKASARRARFWGEQAVPRRASAPTNGRRRASAAAHLLRSPAAAPRALAANLPHPPPLPAAARQIHTLDGRLFGDGNLGAHQGPWPAGAAARPLPSARYGGALASSAARSAACQQPAGLRRLRSQQPACTPAPAAVPQARRPSGRRLTLTLHAFAGPAPPQACAATPSSSAPMSATVGRQRAWAARH